MVGTEIEPGPLPRPLGDPGEEIRLQDAVLVMTLLGPRIGKQDEDIGGPSVDRKHLKKHPGLREKEMKVGQTGPFAFPLGALDPLADNVDPDARHRGMGQRVGRQEMPVPAANFPDKPRGGRENAAEPCAQGFAALVQTGQMLGRAGGIFHGRTARA